MSTEDLIATLASDDDLTSGHKNKKRNRKFDPSEDEQVRDALDEQNILDGLSVLETAAKRIMADTSENKVVSFKDLSKRSATAKLILTAIQNEQSVIQLNTLNTINTLKLLSDIYDNNITE
ncbi:DUF1098 domain-containing protein [Ancylobacter aquaticus]|nr:DUF1098 domain-containing protein [Ancylobacter aquaticus]